MKNGQAQCDLIAMDDEVIEAGKPVTMVNLDSDAIERTVTITPTKVKSCWCRILNGQLAIELPSIAREEGLHCKSSSPRRPGRASCVWSARISTM